MKTQEIDIPVVKIKEAINYPKHTLIQIHRLKELNPEVNLPLKQWTKETYFIQR